MSRDLSRVAALSHVIPFVPQRYRLKVSVGASDSGIGIFQNFVSLRVAEQSDSPNSANEVNECEA